MGIFVILFGVVLLLTALVGSIGPLIAAAGALGAFALCVAWVSSLGSVDMGAAFFIMAVLIGIPGVVFIITFGVSLKRGKNNMTIPGPARVVFLLLGGIVIAAHTYVRDIEKNADSRIETAIQDNKPQAIAKERERNGAWADEDTVKKIMDRHGITEDSLALLRSFEFVRGSVFDAALEYPASPERLHFLRELAKMRVQSAKPKHFIRLMDEGETESADAVYPFVRFPDSAMVRAERPDLLRDVVRRGIPDEYYGSYGSPALVYAAWKDPEYTRILLDAGYDPNTANLRYDGTPPLVEAAAVTAKNHGVAQMLLDAGADPNKTGSNEHQGNKLLSALHVATTRGTAEVMQALLAAGAHIDHKDDTGQTALHMAAMRGNTEAVKLLLEKGANVSIQDGLGMTPLHRAALAGNEKACSLLLAAGAPVDAADTEGRTPLELAVNMGGGPTVAALLENASPATKALAGAANERKKTPWDLAFRYSRPWGYDRLVNAQFGLSDKGFLVKNSDGEIAVPAADVWLTSLNARAATVRSLLAAGADPARRLEEGNTLFHSAFDPQLGEAIRYMAPPRWKGHWKDAHEDALRESFWETLPAVYPQALESLLRAGIPLPALREGETYAKYCRDGPNNYKENLYAECAAVLEAERARREAASS
ncbi:membrane hypothetical protein [uncultured delta proteobacterium]|uniref:Uncharacterized protein n=1 Tax=uncultured delta proteobacterium TaxID=34034 RepID=A0A212J0C1_9DELT|nr:membrane hypothetical protein [uncultured delta proteobacterium]